MSAEFPFVRPRSTTIAPEEVEELVKPGVLNEKGFTGEHLEHLLLYFEEVEHITTVLSAADRETPVIIWPEIEELEEEVKEAVEAVLDDAIVDYVEPQVFLEACKDAQKFPSVFEAGLRQVSDFHAVVQKNISLLRTALGITLETSDRPPDAPDDPRESEDLDDPPEFLDENLDPASVTSPVVPREFTIANMSSRGIKSVQRRLESELGITRPEQIAEMPEADFQALQIPWPLRDGSLDIRLMISHLFESGRIINSVSPADYRALLIRALWGDLNPDLSAEEREAFDLEAILPTRSAPAEVPPPAIEGYDALAAIVQENLSGVPDDFVRVVVTYASSRVSPGAEGRALAVAESVDFCCFQLLLHANWPEPNQVVLPLLVSFLSGRVALKPLFFLRELVRDSSGSCLNSAETVAAGLVALEERVKVRASLLQRCADPLERLLPTFLGSNYVHPDVCRAIFEDFMIFTIRSDLADEGWTLENLSTVARLYCTSLSQRWMSNDGSVLISVQNSSRRFLASVRDLIACLDQLSERERWIFIRRTLMGLDVVDLASTYDHPLDVSAFTFTRACTQLHTIAMEATPEAVSVSETHVVMQPVRNSKQVLIMEREELRKYLDGEVEIDPPEDVQHVSAAHKELLKDHVLEGKTITELKKSPKMGQRARTALCKMFPHHVVTLDWNFFGDMGSKWIPVLRAPVKELRARTAHFSPKRKKAMEVCVFPEKKVDAEGKAIPYKPEDPKVRAQLGNVNASVIRAHVTFGMEGLLRLFSDVEVADPDRPGQLRVITRERFDEVLPQLSPASRLLLRLKYHDGLIDEEIFRQTNAYLKQHPDEEVFLHKHNHRKLSQISRGTIPERIKEAERELLGFPEVFPELVWAH